MPAPVADLPENNRQALRQVARSCRKAALATLQDGAPYVSLVTIALDHDLAPILLLSNLADHTRNLLADRRVSVLFDGTEGHPNPQTGPRVTLTGQAFPAEGDERLKARFLLHHPGAILYASFADFSVWRIQPERVHFVGGFGRAVWFDAPFGLSLDTTSALSEAEAHLLTFANAEHQDDLARLGPGWKIITLDADGVDLSDGQDFRRLNFDVAVENPEGISSALKMLFKRINY